jgi:hypothetical protein
MILNDGGAGSPKPASKVARSCLIVGEPNESTSAMVSPRPVHPSLYKDFMSYAVSNWLGE